MDFFLDNYILIWVCIVGLCLGSFFNVVILRSLSGESIVFPPSKCPKCDNRLKPWHNIPVLSYIFLRGKCAFCKTKISIQYPLIELITMCLFAYSYMKFGLDWKTLFAIILSSTLLIMAMTDIKEKLVDCNIAIILGLTGLLYNWLVLGDVLNSFYGLLAGVTVMELLAWSGYIFVKNRAFGEADTYVAGALGACFGLKTLPIVLLYSLIASALFIIPIFIYNQYKNNQKTICILFILFILSTLAYKTILPNLYLLVTLTILGISLSVAILKNLKTTDNVLYLPLCTSFFIRSFVFFILLS